MEQKTWIYILLGIAVLLVIFLLSDAAATISMTETLLVYALGAAAGFFLLRQAIKN